MCFPSKENSSVIGAESYFRLVFSSVQYIYMYVWMAYTWLDLPAIENNNNNDIILNIIWALSLGQTLYQVTYT